MKGFQKLTLAAAIAAAPFTQAMEAMDDALLSEMTGQAGITIDVNLEMSIDAIKYVDSDGTGALTLLSDVGTGNGNLDSTGTDVGAGNGDYAMTVNQGALTMRGLKVGSIDSTTGRLTGAASIKGVTIDVDGGDGLVIGVGQIGSANTGIDISVDSIQISNGAAQAALLTATEGSGVTPGDLVGQSVQGYSITTSVLSAAADGDVIADLNTYFGEARNFATLSDEDREDFVAGVAAGDLNGNGAPTGNTATAVGAYSNAVVTYALAAQANGVGAGNVGGLIIEDFRNYVEDTFVTTYNDRFDTALGAVSGNYIAAEIKINGTGDAILGTGGLRIEAKMGGLMSKAALTMGEDQGGANGGFADAVHEIGVKDLAFFGTADLNGDQIQDTITAMTVNVDINVVQHGAFEGGTDVAALHLSNMKIEGSIVMGDIYLKTQGVDNERSLGSVLIKDIDMTGTDVFIYGH